MQSTKESRQVQYERVPVTEGLAAERTFLAAERTLLAYLRTALTMFVAGVTGARLLDDELLIGLGYVLAATSLLVFALGVLRHRRSEEATLRMLVRLTDVVGK